MTSKRPPRLSDQMRRIVELLAEPSPVWHSWLLALRLYGHRRKRNRRDGDFRPLTGTQRASLARSVRRLIAAGLVERVNPGRCLRLTAAGRQLPQRPANEREQPESTVETSR